jgi:ABC-type antimicrobial peptide transport system permease subunit
MFLVPGLTPADPISYAGVALLLGITGVLAAWGPARRAVAIEPAASLRYE